MIFKDFIQERLKTKLNELSTVKTAAGVLIKCVKTNNVFLLLRNDKTPVWSLMSGGVDKGESPLDGLKREIYEELFLNPNLLDFKHVSVERIPEKDLVFHYFEGFCQEEFTPILDGENLNYSWCNMNNLPSPLYKGLKDKIVNILK